MRVDQRRLANIAIVVGVSFWGASGVAGVPTCFDVAFLNQTSAASCGAVTVEVTSKSCGDGTAIRRYSPQSSRIDCAVEPRSLSLKLPEGNLTVLVEKKASLWGEATFQVASMKFSRHAESQVAPQVARTVATLPVAEKVQPIEQAIEQEAKPKAEAKIGELTTKFSGFAWVETETAIGYGYSSTGAADFTTAQNNQTTLFSNLEVDVIKGPTQLTSIFEIGEVIDGDAASGGSVGARQKIVEVRNLYLTHDFSENWRVKLGLLPISSDPNSFIFSDHVAAQVLSYQNEKTNASLWHGTATADRPGVLAASTEHRNPDSYFGLQVAHQLTSTTKLSLFGVSRQTIESFYNSGTSATVSGRSRYQWLGLTADQAVGDVFATQASYIANSGQFDADSGGPTDALSASLIDLKVTAKLAEERMEFLLEGVGTTGNTDGVATGQTVQTIGRRRSFSSPDPGAAYLLTIASSDGADDAPGAPRQAVIGNLSQTTGVQIYVFKASKSWSDRFTTFARFGLLKSNSGSLATGSTDMGSEIDLQGAYELSPGTVLQLDAARLTPALTTQTKNRRRISEVA